MKRMTTKNDPMTPEEISETLRLHSLWLECGQGGVPANLSGAAMSGAAMIGANLSYANLNRANLSYANLNRANLSYANLSGANLSYANLSGANLNRANLSYANLNRANLSHANLSGADLSYANLNRANLSYANLSGAAMSGANLIGARIYGQVVTSGAVATWNSTYWAMTFQSEVGRMLVYGCESRSLVEWNEVVAQLCCKHEPLHADRYEAEIRALVALCETLDLRDE